MSEANHAIFLPALTEAQQHFAAKALYELCRVQYSAAKAAVAKAPGIIFEGRPDSIERLAAALQQAGLNPEVRTGLPSVANPPDTGPDQIRQKKTEKSGLNWLGTTMKWVGGLWALLGGWEIYEVFRTMAAVVGESDAEINLYASRVETAVLLYLFPGLVVAGIGVLVSRRR